MGSDAKRGMQIQILLSSSAKADDPVFQRRRWLIDGLRRTGYPLSRVWRLCLGVFHAAKYATRQGCFLSCAFAAAG